MSKKCARAATPRRIINEGHIDRVAAATRVEARCYKKLFAVWIVRGGISHENILANSTKLREMQVSTTPIIAQAWGQSVSGAIGDAITAEFSGNPQTLSPNGTGFTYYFDDNPPAQRSAESD